MVQPALDRRSGNPISPVYAVPETFTAKTFVTREEH